MTRILAIETGFRIASVALCEDQRVCWTTDLPAGNTAGRTLVPAIAQGLSALAWRPNDLELTAVDYGPGSFTGLRVGLATAKAWTFALGQDLLGVSTFEVLASLADPDVASRWWCVVDAQRGQFFVQLLEWGDHGWNFVGETGLLNPDQVLKQLREGDGLIGPGRDRWTADRPSVFSFWAEPQCCFPTAVAVARVAEAAYRRGRRHDPYHLTPWYIRPAAAEEKASASGQPHRLWRIRQ